TGAAARPAEGHVVAATRAGLQLHCPFTPPRGVLVADHDASISGHGSGVTVTAEIDGRVFGTTRLLIVRGRRRGVAYPDRLRLDAYRIRAHAPGNLSSAVDRHTRRRCDQGTGEYGIRADV